MLGGVNECYWWTKWLVIAVGYWVQIQFLEKSNTYLFCILSRDIYVEDEYHEI